MKKVLALSALAVLALSFSTVATAQNGKKGGGKGSTTTTTTTTTTTSPTTTTTTTTTTQPSYVAGQSYYDTSGNKWLEYLAGDAPIIVSVPHDGTLLPTDVPDRATYPTNPNCPANVSISTARDIYTADLAKKIQAAFVTRYNIRPHIVIANLHRKKVDLNRDKPDGACGNAAMEKVWTEWHGFIQSAMNMATGKYGKALYIDLHGHGHTKQRLELGYLYSSSELRSFASSTTYTNSGSFSLANLPRYKNGQVTVRELLFGNTAYGTESAIRARPAVPSAQDPAPLVGDEFFNGGYNTSRYTTTPSVYPNTFGWQIESDGNYRNTSTLRLASANVFSDSVIAFLRNHHPVFTGTSSWTVPAPVN